MAGNRGGARPGAGAIPGAGRLMPSVLMKAVETKTKKSFAESLANAYLKLETDFYQDINVNEYIKFTENLCKRLLADQTQEVHHTVTDLTDSEIDDKLANLQTLLALTKKSNDK